MWNLSSSKKKKNSLSSISFNQQCLLIWLMEFTLILLISMRSTIVLNYKRGLWSSTMQISGMLRVELHLFFLKKLQDSTAFRHRWFSTSKYFSIWTGNHQRNRKREWKPWLNLLHESLLSLIQESICNFYWGFESYALMLQVYSLVYHSLTISYTNYSRVH